MMRTKRKNLVLRFYSKKNNTHNNNNINNKRELEKDLYQYTIYS